MIGITACMLWYKVLTVCAFKLFRLRFIDVDIGWPGKAHVARVLFNSDIYRRGERKELFPKVCRSMNLVFSGKVFCVV